MKRRRYRQNKDSGAPKWMVTYSDMITLILVFFILLFSMSQIDLVKFEALSDSFRNRMIFDFFPSSAPLDYPGPGVDHAGKGDRTDSYKDPAALANWEKQKREEALDALLENVQSFLEEEEIESIVTARRSEQGVALVLQDRILFDTGEATILDTGKPLLQKIGKLIDRIPNHIKVEGHTDSRPINSYRYPSNWELSGARASSVIRYLISEYSFDPTRFSLVGYGETRPVKPNDTLENMQENRRVEILILTDEGDE